MTLQKKAHSEEYGTLQRVVETLFASRKRVTRLDLILNAEAADLCDDLLEIVYLLPAGTYDRHDMCMQLNSAITGHGWGMVYGTVE